MAINQDLAEQREANQKLLHPDYAYAYKAAVHVCQFATKEGPAPVQR